MSLATRIESLVIRVAQEFNDVRATAGSLASLSTNDKSSLVAAINELKAAVLAAMAIDDTAESDINKIILSMSLSVKSAETFRTLCHSMPFWN